MKNLLLLAALGGLGLGQNTAFAGVPDGLPHLPDAVVDLSSREGVDLLSGTWRYSDARIVEVDHANPGPDLKPSGPANRTHDVVPKAGAADFDDSSWEVIDPTSLEKRRSTGRLCFNWYRLRVTIPEKIGALETAGTTAVLEIVVDDYAEVWVDGALPQVLGQTGGALVRGWNAPNRLIVARDIVPGRTIQIAVFGMNAPISSPPGNFIWIRSATLDFYRPGRLSMAAEVPLEIVRLDPALDSIVPPTGAGGTRLERLAGGFGFTEGPVWSPEGYLLFSDPNRNVIQRWTNDGDVSVFRTKSGYKGLDMGEYRQPGSNGLAFDREGRLTICEHGNRRVTRLEKNGTLTVLADRYQGKRLNSPNDLVYRSDGALYFSDPPFGLPKFHDDPRRELPHTGVYCLIVGELKLVTTELSGPNGLAFAPDGKTLYVTNWDTTRKVVMAYDTQPDGSLARGRVFFDMTRAPGEEALDGVKVDSAGNLFVSGPGGVWVLSPSGKHMGTLVCPELPANFAWGSTGELYMTARTGLYRLQLGPRSKPSAGR